MHARHDDGVRLWHLGMPSAHLQHARTAGQACRCSRSRAPQPSSVLRQAPSRQDNARHSHGSVAAPTQALTHLLSASAGAVVSAFVRVPTDTLKHRVQAYLLPDVWQVRGPPGVCRSPALWGRTARACHPPVGMPRVCRSLALWGRTARACHPPVGMPWVASRRGANSGAWWGAMWARLCSLRDR